MPNRMTGIFAAAIATLANGNSLADVTFRVTLDAAGAEGVSGRLIVSLVDDSIPSLKGRQPNDSPFWEPPQPMFAIDVRGLATGQSVEMASASDAANIASTRELSGTYRVQARLIAHHDTSNWREDAGNFFSEAVKIECSKEGVSKVTLSLSGTTRERAWPEAEAKALGVQLIDIRSALLSDFHKREVHVRAGVVLPTEFDEKRTYAAVYEVPGFGGRHFDAINVANRRKNAQESEWSTALAKQAFWIVLDPESPNGHTLFADSANNGPCGRALTEELIPAIEAKFPQLTKKTEGRLLRGHSSGGWSTLWLAITYPEVFGATWSSSPDPIDFRRLQLCDIYSQQTMYAVKKGEPSFAPLFGGSNHNPVRLRDLGVSRVEIGGSPEVIGLGSFRTGGKCIMTVDQECKGEDLIGPGNTSGQQWDSWFAAWGPRDSEGHPAALFDPKTGIINHSVANEYKKYDIAEKFRERRDYIGSLFRERIRLLVGDADNFCLNEAVELFQEELNRDYKPRGLPSEVGYIGIVRGVDHGTIFGSRHIQHIPQEMMEHLVKAGLVPEKK